MTLNITLPSDAEKRLRQQAATAGVDVLTFVREAIEEKLALAEGRQPASPHVHTPRLVNPAQAVDFAKQIVEVPGNGRV